MSFEESHLSDRELLEIGDGELPADRARSAAAHLAACWECRARKLELDGAIAGFVRVHRRHLDPLLPPVAGPRALLKAQLAELSAGASSRPRLWLGGNPWNYRLAQLVVFCALVALGVFAVGRWGPVRRVKRYAATVLPMPSGRLTPGVAVPLTRAQVCEVSLPKNRAVPASLQRRVFEAYGISDADPRAYEVDYLITPALGGADDIRNLWPQPYYAAVWNARVKDALEDRLRTLVCSGAVDLATAQRDIATDWIGAYKKYFHTGSP